MRSIETEESDDETLMHYTRNEFQVLISATLDCNSCRTSLSHLSLITHYYNVSGPPACAHAKAVMEATWQLFKGPGTVWAYIWGAIIHPTCYGSGYKGATLKTPRKHLKLRTLTDI